MSTVYTFNSKVLKNTSTDKWLAKKETPPAPVVIQPDSVPDQSQSNPYTAYNGPKMSGDKLDYNTTYTINYPSGYTIRELNIGISYGNNWQWSDIAYTQPPPNTINLSDYLTSSQWNDTNVLCFKLLDSYNQTIYVPITLTPV